MSHYSQNPGHCEFVFFKGRGPEHVEDGPTKYYTSLEVDMSDFYNDMNCAEAVEAAYKEHCRQNGRTGLAGM